MPHDPGRTACFRWLAPESRSLWLVRGRPRRPCWKSRRRFRPEKPPPWPPRSMRPCSIHARRSGLQRGVSWPHHARAISPGEIEMTVIDHAMVAGSRDHFAQQRNALAALPQNLADLFDGVGLHDRNHADTAVEGAQQLQLGNTALLGQPLEYRQHG